MLLIPHLPWNDLRLPELLSCLGLLILQVLFLLMCPLLLPPGLCLALSLALGELP